MGSNWIAAAACIGIGIVLTACIGIFLFPHLLKRYQLPKSLGKVFASYAHEDEPIVVFISTVIKALGGELVRDRTHIKGGEIWRIRLRELIDESDSFQLFWSRRAAASNEVEEEWRYALESEKTIYPIAWEKDCPPPEDLKHIQFIYVDLDFKNREAKLAGLIPSWTNLQKLPAGVALMLLLSVVTVMAATFVGVKKLTTPPPESRRDVLPDPPRPIESGSPQSSPAEDKPAQPTRIRVSLSQMSFAAIKVGTSAGIESAQVVAVTNTDSAPVKIDSVRVRGSNPRDFKIVFDGCTRIPVLTRKQCQIKVEFIPTAEGVRQANLEIVNGADAPAVVSLKGGVIPTKVTVTVTSNRKSLDFGIVPVGGGVKTITVRVKTNSFFGFQADNRYADVPTTGSDFRDFVVIMSAPNPNYPLGPLQRPRPPDDSFAIKEITCLTPLTEDLNSTFCDALSITVSFWPKTAGKHAALLGIMTADSSRGKGHLSLPISGSGVK